MSTEPLISISGLEVHFGQSHILQGVDLDAHDKPVSIVGRNGMGKTTLCQTLMGLAPSSGGSIRFQGQELIGKKPHEITKLGIGYVPQGSRVYRSLNVDEHLRVGGGVHSVQGKRDWTIERLYDFFPQLYDRRRAGGAELSGGEQQMLAIARSLLINPRLLVMDEPTEGLAPVIVDHLVQLLNDLAQEDIGLLLIEQNLRVASEVSDSLAIMVNGQIAEHSQSQKMLSDRSMQQRLLGVGGEQGVVTTAATQSNTEIFSFNFEMESLVSNSASGQSSRQLRIGFVGNIVRAGVQRLPEHWIQGLTDYEGAVAQLPVTASPETQEGSQVEGSVITKQIENRMTSVVKPTAAPSIPITRWTHQNSAIAIDESGTATTTFRGTPSNQRRRLDDMETINGKQLAVDKHLQSGGAPLIMIHGLGGTSNVWSPQVSVLSGKFSICVPDLNGAGRSPLDGEISIAGLMADVVAMMDAFDVEKAHLAGHSMGTIVCQHLATNHPQRVMSLALMGPVPALPEPARPVLRDRAAKARSDGMRPIAEAVVEAATSSDTKTNQPAIAAFVRELLMRQDAESYARHCEALADSQSADLAAIQCPTLLITGDQDKVAPPDVMEALRSQISGAQAHLMTGCGHWTTLERAKQVNYLMVKFYNDIGA